MHIFTLATQIYPKKTLHGFGWILDRTSVGEPLRQGVCTTHVMCLIWNRAVGVLNAGDDDAC